MEPFQYKIVGTSHVAKGSVKEIKHEIKSFQPDIVCIELDKGRLEGLLSNQKSNFSPKLILQIGLAGYVFGLIGHLAQKKIGEKLNIIPGKDMLTAFKLAKKEKLPVALIDQNVRITLKNVSKNFRFKEKWKLTKDIFESIFFKKRAMKKAQEKLGNTAIDLNSAPSEDMVESLINQLKTDYPGLHKALVDDRNKFMANNICKILKKEPTKKVLIVVGAGHQKEMEKIIDHRKKNWEYISYNYTTSIE